MPDLPDYYTQTIGIEVRATSIEGGADASKSASPEAKDVYFATDTEKLWYCITDGAWADYFFGADTAITLTNKTLTTPVIATLYQDAAKTKLITFPAETDTVVVLAATQTLTNKTLASPTIQGILGAGTGLTMPAFTAGGDIIGQATYDLGSAASPFAEAYIGNATDYLKVAIVANIPTIYGKGAYVRIGDAITTQQSLNSEDDLLVTGELEVIARMYTSDIRVGVNADLYIQDDRDLKFGIVAANDFAFRYLTSDANAQLAIMWFRKSDANQVPVFVIGDTGAVVDLGAAGLDFAGITEPRLAIVDDDVDSAVCLGFNADDDARIILLGSAALTLPAFTMAGALNMGDNILDELPSTVSDVVGSRAVDTVYRNTSSRPRLVMCGFNWSGVGDLGDIQARIGAADPPTTNVARESGDQASGGQYAGLCFLVPDDYYYALVVGGTAPSLDSWVEIDLFA